MAGFMSGVSEMFNYAFNSLDMTSSANDIIVVQHADGSLHASPFIVRFGKVKVLRPQDKVVSIEVNGKPTTAIMKIASDGTAYWLRGDASPNSLIESPLESPLPQSPVVGPDSPFSQGVQADVMPPTMNTVEIRTPQETAAHPAEPPTSTAADPTSTAAEAAALTGTTPLFKTPFDTDPDHRQPVFPDMPHPPSNTAPESMGVVLRLLAEEDPQQLLTHEPSVGGILQSLATEAAAPANVSPPPQHGGPADSSTAEAVLRLARLASTDNIDVLPLGHLSLNTDANMMVDHRNDVAPSTAGELLSNMAVEASREHHQDPTASLAPIPDAALQQQDVVAGPVDEFSTSDEDEAVASYNSASSLGAGEVNRLVAGAATQAKGEPEAGAKRSIFATHHDLMRLHLKPGPNTIKFSTGTTLRGKVDITANIFLWAASSKLVVSDVDGTVTKSDVMGHIATFFGKDWTHPGLCALYSKIAKNGYHFVYLTARSVSQVDATRHFLFNVEQEGMRLPHGPVLTAPDKLFSALTQELSKKSHEFKITCLAQVRNAFPPNTKPFYAGFGNRIGDVVAYTASDISQHKIFIINKDSVLHIASVKKSYRDLSHLVDETFPARKQDADYLYEYFELRERAAAAAPDVSSQCRSPSPRSDNSSSQRASPRHDAASPAAAVTPVSAPSYGTANVEVEPEFNSFNYWRVDPQSVTAPDVGTLPAGSATPSPVERSGKPPKGRSGEESNSSRWHFWKRQGLTRGGS